MSWPKGVSAFMYVPSRCAVCLEAHTTSAPTRSTLDDSTSSGAWIEVSASLSNSGNSVLRRGGTLSFGTEIDADGNVVEGAGLHALVVLPQPAHVDSWEVKFVVWVQGVLIGPIVKPPEYVLSDADKERLLPETPKPPREFRVRDTFVEQLKTGVRVWDGGVTISELARVPPRYIYVSVQANCVGEEAPAAPIVVRAEIRE